MTIMPTNVTQILFIQEVVEPEILPDSIVERLNLVEEENNYLKEKIKKIEEEKMILELHVADVVDDHKIKMEDSEEEVDDDDDNYDGRRG